MLGSFERLTRKMQRSFLSRTFKLHHFPIYFPWVGLVGALFSAVLQAYTFTDQTRRQFEVEIISLTAETVTVKRTVDGRSFTVLRSSFSTHDQDYFASWRPETVDRSYGLREGESIRALPRQLRVHLTWDRGDFNHFEIERSQSERGYWARLENPTPVFHVFRD